MTLTEQDVRDIAEYARIGLTDDELSTMTVDLNNIIETLKPITCLLYTSDAADEL